MRLRTPSQSFYFFLFFLLRTCTWELKHVCCLRCVFHTFVFCIHIYIPFAHVHERRNGMDRERKVIYIHLRGDDEEGEQARKREKRVRRNVCMMCDHINKKKISSFPIRRRMLSRPPTREKESEMWWEREREENFFSFFIVFILFFPTRSHIHHSPLFHISRISHTTDWVERGKNNSKICSSEEEEEEEEGKEENIHRTYTHSESDTYNVIIHEITEHVNVCVWGYGTREIYVKISLLC